MPTRRPARQPEPPPGASRTEAETAAAIIAGRLRIDIRQARLIVARVTPAGAFGTIGWQCCMMPLPELRALAAEERP